MTWPKTINWKSCNYHSCQLASKEKCFFLSYILYCYRYVTRLLNGVVYHLIFHKSHGHIKYYDRFNNHNGIHIAHNKTQNHFLRNTNDVAFDIIYKNIIFIALSNKIDQLSIFHWISSLQKQNLWSIRRLVPDKGIISQRPFFTSRPFCGYPDFNKKWFIYHQW